MRVEYFSHDDIVSKQRMVDEVKTSFRACVNDIKQTLATLILYVNCADDMRIKRVDHYWVAGFLRGSGYKINAHVGKPKKEFRDARIMAEYVIGQYISGVKEMGMVNPNLIDRFGQEAINLFDT